MSDATKAVFLSYASQDAEAAKRIADALRAAGVEVWFDQNELVGGDAWDQKIRRQIKECALLIPIISENTQQRTEGYFRLEWRLADQRTHLMAKGRAFLLPVVIDDTSDDEAAVPDSFLDVQWSRLRPLGYAEASPPVSEDPVLAKFVARVKDLLSADPSARAKVPRFTGQWSEGGTNNPDPIAFNRSQRPRWLLPVFGGVGVAVIALVIARPWSRPIPSVVSPSNPAAASGLPSPAASVPAAPAWPADPDLKRATEILNRWDGTAESYTLAEDMVKAVLAKTPTDTDATIVYAMVNDAFLNRGFDISEERFALGRRYAERALTLAPDHPEALAAMAQFVTFQERDFARAEKLIRRAIELAPQESRFRRILAYNILYPARPQEAIELVAENVRLFPDDPLNHYNQALIARGTGDLVLMEAALDRCLAVAPVGSAMVWKGWLAAWQHGDLPGFKAWLDRIPGDFRVSDRVIFMSYVYACLSGDTAYGIQAVKSSSSTWMRDFYYNGPRALLLGDLYALDGKAEVAREYDERALAEINRRQKEIPGDAFVRGAEVWALYGLGRLDEAKKPAQRWLEAQRRPYRQIYMIWWHGPIPALLLLGQRADALALMKEAAESSPAVREQLRVALRIDPRMKPFRDDAEILALLAEPAGK